MNHMKQAQVIIVSGPPASGKTTLAKALADELKWPLASKDGYKEALMDALGWSTEEWSKQMGKACMKLVLLTLEDHLRANLPIIVEGSFRNNRDHEPLQKLCAQYDVSALEVHCTASSEILRERYIERMDSADRHPGHLPEKDRLEEHLKRQFIDEFDNYKALGFIDVVEVDTSQGFNTDAVVEEIIKRV